MEFDVDESEYYFQLGPTENEHFFISGSAINLPLIIHCGYNNLVQASRLTWHDHEGFEFVLVLEGSAFYEYEDGATREIVGGEYFVNPPRLRHRGGLDVGAPSKMCWIVFCPSSPSAEQNTTFQQTDLALIEEKCIRNSRKPVSLTPSMKTLLCMFRDAITRRPESQARDLNAARIRSLVCQLIVESSDNIDRARVTQHIDMIDAIKRHVDAGYAEDLNVETLAAEYGLSRGRFHSVFKSATGQTPLDYLQRQRIKHAQRLLATSRDSVTDVALNTGFNSSQYFSKVFRKYTGCTPLEYRLRKQTEHGAASLPGPVVHPE